MRAGWVATQNALPPSRGSVRNSGLTATAIRVVGEFHSGPVPCHSIGCFHSCNCSDCRCPWYCRCRHRVGSGSFGLGCLDPFARCCRPAVRRPSVASRPFAVSRSSSVSVSRRSVPSLASGSDIHEKPYPVLDCGVS